MMEAYEQERLESLEARRRDEPDGADQSSLEERFGPGSFGCHEALHVTNLVVELIERELAGHSAVLLDPSWYARVRKAQALLYGAYNDMAQGHLGAPPKDEGAIATRSGSTSSG